MNQPPGFSQRLGMALTPLVTAAARPGDDEDERLRKALLLGGSLAICPVAAVWGGLYAFYGETSAALITLGYGFINLAGLLLLIYTGRRRPFAVLQLLCTLLLPLALTLVLGGVAASSAVIIGAFMAPIGAMLYFDRQSAAGWFTGFVGVLTLAAVMGPRVPQGNNLPSWLVTALFVLNVSIVALLAFYETQVFIRQRDRALYLLGVEQAKSERLLTNTLPASIAAILKEEESTIADRYESVSVLFADLVGYTELSSHLPPVDLVEMLNAIYSEFDMIIDRHGLEKIRTMGDGYMVASGVPEPRSDHAQALASAALEMLDFFTRWEASRLHHMSLRIGINSGPVVAGVIGRRKFSYDVWGDTVNVASRMESQGIANRIQISDPTHTLLADQFDMSYRGLIEVKGKGMMETWFLEGPFADSSQIVEAAENARPPVS